MNDVLVKHLELRIKFWAKYYLFPMIQEGLEEEKKQEQKNVTIGMISLFSNGVNEK